jgi:hypothetical protein
MVRSAVKCVQQYFNRRSSRNGQSYDLKDFLSAIFLRRGTRRASAQITSRNLNVAAWPTKRPVENGPAH